MPIPNFQILFIFSGKEIIYTTIDDLLPEPKQNFHKFIIADHIKFTNIEFKFKKKKRFCFKRKNGMKFNINLYIKSVPNFSFRLMLFIYMQKLVKKTLL